MPRINRSPVSNARDVSLDTSPNPDPSTVAPASHPPSSGDGIDLGESSTDVSPSVPRGVGAPSVSSSGPGVLRHTLEARMSGPEAPPAPEVKALLDQYGIQERLGRPRERIVSWAAKAKAKPPKPSPATNALTGLSLSIWAMLTTAKRATVTRKLLRTMGTSMSSNLVSVFSVCVRSQRSGTSTR